MTSGNIRKFGRKGYESISRDMLQDKRLTFRDIGLLSHLASHDTNNFTIYKTALYSRHEKESRSVVTKAWNNLMSCGYIVQYRKRTGQSYDYQYIFSTMAFSIEDLEEIEHEMTSAGYDFYVAKSTIDVIKDLVEDSNSISDVQQWIVDKSKYEIDKKVEQKEQVQSDDFGVSIYDSPNPKSGVSNINTPKNVSTTGFSGVSIGNSSQTAVLRTVNIKNIEEEEEDLNGQVEKLIAEMNGSKSELPEWEHGSEIQIVYDLLLSHNFPRKDATMISNQIDKQFDNLYIPECIVAQIDWCVHKLETENIYNLPYYFLQGLVQKVAVSSVSCGVESTNIRDRFLNAYSKTKTLPSKKVPLHNWIKNGMYE